MLEKQAPRRAALERRAGTQIREPRVELEKLKAHARGLEKKLKTLTHELSEAGERQTATSEVLGVISSSPGELEPVFRAMLENAVWICEAGFGTLFRFPF